MGLVTKIVSSFNYSQVITHVRNPCAVIQVGNTTAKRSARVAPVRSKFSHQGSDDEDEEGSIHHPALHHKANSPFVAQASDELVSSDAELRALTAKQINAEVSEQTWIQWCNQISQPKAANPGSRS
jgi:hypothetical protein